MKKLLIVFTMFFLFVAKPALALIEESDNAEQQFEGFNMQGYDDDGNKSWDLTGRTADIDGGKVHLSDVNANAYGDQNVNVTSEVGVFDQTSGDVYLEKDVIITGQDGGQLLTDSLDWSKENDLVRTDDEILITDDQFTVTGMGMEAKPGLKHATIHEDVTVRVNVEDKNAQEPVGDPKTVTITCDGPVEMDQGNGMAVFNNNVFAIQEDKTLKADKMEIKFDEEMKQIDKMICIGNVEIVQGNNKTLAEKAVYDGKTQKLTLLGRPKLILVTEGDNAFTSFGD